MHWNTSLCKGLTNFVIYLLCLEISSYSYGIDDLFHVSKVALVDYLQNIAYVFL